MRIGVSTTLVQHGRSEVGRYLVPLLAALLRHVPEHEYVLYLLEEDMPLLAFARDRAQLVVVGRGPRSGTEDLTWHHVRLPALAREHRLDVLHIPTERRMLWRRPCALVTTVHHLGPFRRPRARTSRGSCPGAVFRALARRQDAVLLGSTAAAHELSQLTGLAPAQLAVTPPGAEVSRFGSVPRDLAAAELIRRYSIHPPFFLVVGCREDAPRAHQPLIRGFDALKTVTPSPWQLVFITGGPANTQRVRLLARQSPYAADIHCLDDVPADELPLWYGAAGGLVHAPPDWGYAGCVTAALAAGCPGLVTDVAEARAEFGDAVLYAEAHDAAALHRQLRELATNVLCWSRLQAAGRQWATGRHWQTTARLTADAYERSASPSPTNVKLSGPWSGVAQPRT